MGNETNKSGTTNSRNKYGSRLDQLYYGAVIVGLIIVGVSILAIKYGWVGTTESRVILCSGLGIILGAFGSTATVKYRGVVITGVAAIAIILSYVVVDQAAQTMKKDAFGTILGDFSHANIEISGDHTYLGAFRRRSKQYDFVVEGQINVPTIKLDITFRDKDGNILREPTYVIESKHINKYIGTGTKFEWKYNKEEDSIKDSQYNVVGIIITKRDLPGKNYSSGFLKPSKSWVLPSPVFAETQRSPRDIFYDLTSESASARRGARSELAAIGPSIIKPMMEEFRKRENIYRIRLGVLVALTEMLKNNKSLAPEIIKNLNDDDRRLLVKCLNDNDLTIRIDASLFLYDLGDTGIIPMALKSAKNIDNPDYLYLHFVAINGPYRNIRSEEEKRSIREELQAILANRPASGLEKTRKLFDSHYK